MAGIRFREKNLTVIAVVGVVGLLALVVGSVQLARLPVFAGASYSAQFAEIGGLRAGDRVVVAGNPVGQVTSVELDGALVRVGFTVRDVPLGTATTAEIKTRTLLGERTLSLTSDGPGELAAGDEIPVQRTRAPYDLVRNIEDLTGLSTQVDYEQVGQALDVFSATFADTPEDIAPAFDGITRLSRVISERDEQLTELLRRAESVTGLLRDNTQRLTTVLADGRELLAELDRRRDVITRLIASTTAVTEQIVGLTTEQQGVLAPALDELNGVLRILRENEGNIVSAITRVSSFITPLGEGLATGSFFTGFAELGGVGFYPTADFVPGLAVPMPPGGGS